MPPENDCIVNPVLPGFNPDPSICRVGDDYYMATSTFEWYPGVQIHHSQDLVNWQLVARPLDRADLLDMTGAPDSCGVWAPCFTWCDGLFYLVYTHVKRFDGNFKDTHNYLITCDRIDGKWSEKIYLNSSGFDPSLFHDDDGKKYLLNMVWDHRGDRSFFGGVLLQEYDSVTAQLVGRVHNIFAGSSLGLTEGPHLYKWKNYYYLLCAEGGTGYEHAMTMARSKSITGPYEVDPIGHFITAKDDPQSPLQRCGHGGLVRTSQGQWYVTHLCSRPIPGLPSRRSPMGRESAIQKLVESDDGWFRLESGGITPSLQVAPPQAVQKSHAGEPIRYQFNDTELHQDFQWLRVADPSAFLSLADNPGSLRLYGKESLGSWYCSALVARRQAHFEYVVTTQLNFSPTNFQQMAGLVCYYNAHKFHYLYVSWDENKGVHLSVMSCLADLSLAASFPIAGQEIALEAGSIFLRAKVHFDRLTFYWSKDGECWHRLELELDYSVLSDEAGKGEGANFTGTFVGMCCQDVSGQNCPADFKFFEYRPLG